MRLKIAIIVFGLGTGAFVAQKSVALESHGRALVVDGDTLVVQGATIRLHGIDAPETDQLCLDAIGAHWTCGIMSRQKLAEHIGSRPVSCTHLGYDRYKRIISDCYAENENLNAWMVREGFALAYVKYSSDYISEETAARNDKRGMWAGAFIAPWIWRHRDKRTTVLGALSVPLTAQKTLLAPASAAEAPSQDCIIKGNVNRNGEHIYHLPGQMAYGKINMKRSEKRWFCTEAEARAAGWRPAAR